MWPLFCQSHGSCLPCWPMNSFAFVYTELHGRLTPARGTHLSDPTPLYSHSSSELNCHIPHHLPSRAFSVLSRLGHVVPSLGFSELPELTYLTAPVVVADYTIAGCFLCRQLFLVVPLICLKLLAHTSHPDSVLARAFKP